jgi:hypothetical protein
VSQSTSLSIVEQSLTDTLERLAEMPATAPVRALLQRARALERVVLGWPAKPPSATERAEMLKRVLELNVEVMNFGRTSERAPAARPVKP